MVGADVSTAPTPKVDSRLVMFPSMLSVAVAPGSTYVVPAALVMLAATILKTGAATALCTSNSGCLHHHASHSVLRPDTDLRHAVIARMRPASSKHSL